ncbi:hypothetical protein [Motilimonas cestriensis]|uniref:hypothetical protein n=1 Tax=Motilimonas cestriensis TaxID=2742685 RepID=UPI003DA3942C
MKNAQVMHQQSLADYLISWRSGIIERYPEPKLGQVIYYMHGYYHCVFANGRDSRWCPVVVQQNITDETVTH